MSDDIFIKWAKKADTFSDQVVYEEVALTAAAQSKDSVPNSDIHEKVKGCHDYLELDPLCPKDDPRIIGSFRLGQATGKMLRLGYLFIYSILQIINSQDAFVEATTTTTKKKRFHVSD